MLKPYLFCYHMICLIYSPQQAGDDQSYLYLQAEVRAGISSFALANQDLIDEGVQLLTADLITGEWVNKYGDIRNLTEIDLGYRFLRATLNN